MPKLNKLLLCAMASCLWASCEKQEAGTDGQRVVDAESGHEGVAEGDAAELKKAELASELMKRDFPVFPYVEPSLWRKLLAAEEAGDRAESKLIADELRAKYPFQSDVDTMTLGGISYYKKTREVVIMAEVNYPRKGDDRHPDELELILCSDVGRTHETLFVTEARPLHLEILLHLAGFSKTIPRTAFKVEISIPNHEPIAVEEMMVVKPEMMQVAPLRWEFSGGEFAQAYQPDMTGDLLICWQVHESVLSVNDEKIASGVKKLVAKRHPALKQGMKVKLILTSETD